MNEPNKERMIPLHIADKAVAACNKEIAELQAQVERLRAAGDDLVTLVNDLNNLMDMSNEHPEVLAWEAAKKL